MIQTAFRDMHPILKLVFLLCMLVVGLAVSAVIAGLYAFSTGAGLTDVSVSIVASIAFQILGVFSVGFIYWLLMDRGVGVGFSNEGSSKAMLVFALAGMLATMCFAPYLDLSFRLNDWLLSHTSVYEWASGLEAQAMVMTKEILTMNSVGELLLCLFAIAVLPAICEEFAFRGAIQPLIAKWSGNVHIGIWVSAILFSAIHFQFLGFFPRMLLGAGFGYLVAHSGSLWTGVAAHLINNATVVLLAYFMGAEWLESGLEPTKEALNSSNLFAAVICGAIIIAIAFGLSKISVWRKNESSYLGLEQ